ncbi:MAG: HAMP domain-containing histidine kinase [Lachnospiraceae bacterium]|nr:HAMP domain-containing histidine kinase [Lachnospiraceae bacterium]
MDIKLIVAVAVLCILLVVVIIKYILYRRQVINICRQMVFIKENDTNMIIYNDIIEKEILNLTSLINLMCEEHKAKENILKEKDKRLKIAMAGISHDIRTPLTSLRGFFELLETETDTEKKKKYSKIIDGKLIELTELLEELFTYTKLQNEDYVLELGRYDFTKIVLGTLFSFYGTFKDKNIETELDIYEEQVIVTCNDVAVKRMLSNILKNAMLHGSGKIEIIYKTENGRVEFLCKNSVENPWEIDISQVFDRFYKADMARSKGSTGLGLSVAKELAGRMGGDISACIKDGMFIIKLVMPL